MEKIFHDNNNILFEYKYLIMRNWLRDLNETFNFKILLQKDLERVKILLYGITCLAEWIHVSIVI